MRVAEEGEPWTCSHSEWATSSLSHLPFLFQVCVSQLQVDGGWQCWLSGPPKGLHPPWLPGFWRHLDEAGGQFWQAQADQQRAWWSRPRKLEVNPDACCPSLAPLTLERVLLLLWCSRVLLSTRVCVCSPELWSFFPYFSAFPQNVPWPYKAAFSLLIAQTLSHTCL